MELLISILHALKSCQLPLRQTAAAFHAALCTTESCPLTLYRAGESSAALNCAVVVVVFLFDHC